MGGGEKQTTKLLLEMNLKLPISSQNGKHPINKKNLGAVTSTCETFFMDSYLGIKAMCLCIISASPRVTNGQNLIRKQHV